MGQGIWLDSDTLKPDDEVREVLKHGTLSVGFIGLAETLVALIGEHHGQSERAQQLGLKIIGHMRDRCDARSEEKKLNYTLLATPAEGLSGRFVKIDQKRYGKIEGVTDREYYTNSFHIPVYYPISAFDKIRLEAPYHALTNAGHISYVELADYTQLFQMTWLDRLWFVKSGLSDVEQRTLIEALPNTEVSFYSLDDSSVDRGWRYHDSYFEMRDNLGMSYHV